MRINRTETFTFKQTFKGVRKDIETIKELKTGTNPITENKKRNIFSALKNIAQAPNSKNIEALLDVARNRAYGIDKDSQYHKELLNGEDFEKGTQNIDWETMLNITLIKAIQKLSQTEGNEDIIAQINQYAGSPEFKKLTPVQKEILELRDKLISSLKKQIETESNDKEENETALKKLNDNFTYFLSSSETTYENKKECLKKFLYLLSDEYEINPDLQLHKIQIVNEMLADMLIKTPADKVLTTKGVDQRQSGICAAISVCRKLLAYEDKVQYMNTVLNELDNKPEMEVYDITELGSGKKVSIDKPYIDFEDAISKGYRILDASAHIWMQNAHAGGDGTIQTEWYNAFDSINRGIFDDSSWFGYIPDKYAEKDFLKASIQENNILDSIYRHKRETQILKNQAYQTSKGSPLRDKSSALLLKTLRELFPEYSPSQINQLEKNLIKFYRSYNQYNEINVPQKLTKEEQQGKLEKFILSEDKNVNKDLLKSNIGRIFSLTETLSEFENNYKKAKYYNTPSGKFRYYQKLFKAAASHRNSIESDVVLPSYKIRYEKMADLKPQDIRLSEYLHDIYNQADEETKAILEPDIEFTDTLPDTINFFLDLLFDEDLKSVLIRTYDMANQSIQEGDYNTLDTIAVNLGIPNNPSIVSEMITGIIEKLKETKSPDDEFINEAARILGYSSLMSCFLDTISSFYEYIQTEGINEAIYNKLMSVYETEDINTILTDFRQDIDYLYSQYNQIQSKWQFPSSTSEILRYQEIDNEILTKEELDYLYGEIKAKREAIIKQTQNIQSPKEKAKITNKIINFSKREEELYKRIESQLTHMRKYSKRNYKLINQLLAKEIEDQYSYIGKLNGQYWVREEGSTGLLSNEQLRITEQMTGKPYHIESNIDKAVAKIKEGEGSGILNSSVDDKDYAFHAQYITDVSPLEIKDKESGEYKQKDVLWTDNSWGKSEKEYWWENPSTGLKYTDYGSGYGWKDGFILHDSYKIGLPVEDMKYSAGYSQEDKESFGLINNFILPGTPLNSYVKLVEMVNDILAIEKQTHKGYLEALQNEIASKHEDVSPDFLEKLDDMLYQKSETITKRIKKEIKSEEDYEKLPQNDPLKLTLKKLSISAGVSDNKGWSDMVLTADSMEELENIRKDAFKGYSNLLKLIVNKSDIIFDQLLKIMSDDIDEIFDEIKTKYKTSFSDEEIDELNITVFEQENAEEEWDGSYTDLENYLFRRVDEAAKSKIFQNHPQIAQFYNEKLKSLIKETLDENVKILSFSSPAFSESEFKMKLVDLIDNFYNPSSDEELLEIIQNLQNADRKSVQPFFDSIKEEDLGLIYPTPYECVRLLNAENNYMEKRLDKIIINNIIYNSIRTSAEDEANTPDELYRALYISLADMDIQRHIRKLKAEVLQKYKIHQAFPQPIVLKNESIKKSTEDFLDTIDLSIDNIRMNKSLNNILKIYKKGIEELQQNHLFKALLNGETSVDYNEIPNEINAIADFINSLYSAAKHDEAVLDKYISADILKDFLITLKEQSNEVNLNSLQSSLQKVTDLFDKYMQSSSIEATANTIKHYQNVLKENVKIFINSSIDKRYRNAASLKLKNYIKEYIKDPVSQEKTITEDIFTDFVIYRHITKNPTALLNEVVKDMKDNDKLNSEEYKIKKYYLLMALNVAEKTKVQYDLVENQHKGYSSKLKIVLPSYNVVTKDGERKTMLSNDGLSYLIYQLANEADNYETLKLFLEQTGLSAQAIKSITSAFDLNRAKKIFNTRLNGIKKQFKDAYYLNTLIDNFMNDKSIHFHSLKESLEKFKTYLLEETSNIKKTKTIKKYIKMVKDIKVLKETDMTDEDFIRTKSTVPILKQEWAKLVNDIKIDYLALEQTINIVENQANLVSQISVPQNSEEFKLKEEYFQKIMELKRYTQQAIKEFNEINLAQEEA